MSITGGGAQAELAVIPEATAMIVPDGIPWDQAGGFPEVFCTAYDALFTQAGLLAGERVLISGAAGGVGSAAVQLAHAAGAHVVASVRSAERQGEVAALGADEVIEPEAVADHGPYDVSLGAGRRPGSGRGAAGAGHRGPGGGHRRGGRGQGRRQPVGGHGAAGHHRRARPCARGPWRRRPLVAGPSTSTSSALLAQGTVTVPVVGTFPMAGRPRPTTGSPPAGSWARSSCWLD